MPVYTVLGKGEINQKLITPKIEKSSHFGDKCVYDDINGFCIKRILSSYLAGEDIFN